MQSTQSSILFKLGRNYTMSIILNSTTTAAMINLNDNIVSTRIEGVLQKLDNGAIQGSDRGRGPDLSDDGCGQRQNLPLLRRHGVA